MWHDTLQSRTYSELYKNHALGQWSNLELQQRFEVSEDSLVGYSDFHIYTLLKPVFCETDLAIGNR